MANNDLAYGFTSIRHLIDQRVTEVGASTIYDAVVESAAEHTRQINALLSSMVFRVTRRSDRYVLAKGGSLQPLDEWGNPLPVVMEGYYDVAYPILGGGTAWGTSRVARQLMTVEEANQHTLQALQWDADWLRKHLLCAILDKATWTFDESPSDLTIQCLANGDSVTYVKKGTSTPATDNHYLAQTAAIADATNPFAAIYTELMEHSSNRGPVVVYNAANVSDDITGLTNFVPVGDPDLNYGIGATQISASIEKVRGVGQEVLGKIDRCWIVEWGELPDDYMIAQAIGTGAFMAMREYPSAALQGFFPEQDVAEGRTLNKLLRYAGFGVANRIAALAFFVEAGDTTYDTPSGYDRPIVE